MNEAPFNELIASWRRDAEVRLKRVANDPVAATLDYCAAELAGVVARETLKPRTPAEFADLCGVTEQTVTSWCRRGLIEAYQDATGHWRIPGHVEAKARVA